MINIRQLTVGLLLASVLAGCSSNSTSTDRAGSKPQPVALTLGTTEEESTPAGHMVKEFVAEVDRLSDHRITITPTYHLNASQVSWDQSLVSSAQAGKYDLVLAASRAWHESGVETLDVLQVPGLLEDDAQADRLLASGVPAKLLAGLQPAKMVGLALLPEALRYLISLDGRPISSATLQGARVRVAAGPVLGSVVRALGATPVDLPFADFANEVYSRTVTATEVSIDRLATMPVGSPHAPPIAAINHPLYFKFQVLAMTERAAARLGSDRPLLETAAAATLTEVRASRVRTAAALVAACAAGQATSTIADADLTAMRQQEASAAAAASSGPNGALLAELRAAAGAPSDPPAVGCPLAPASSTTTAPPSAPVTSTVAAPSTAPSTSSAPSVTVSTPSTMPAPIVAPLGDFPVPTDRSTIVPAKGDIPNGVYRAAFSAEQLDVVEPNIKHDWKSGGALEWTLHDGTWTLQGYTPDGAKDGAVSSSTYHVEGNHVVWVMPGGSGLPGTDGIIVFEWSLDGSTLHFRQIDGKLRDPWFAFPYERVDTAG